MKKFMTNIKTVAVLLMASATFAACSSDDNIIDQQPVQPAGQQVYTMTVNASKGGDAATTRALTLDGKTLNASWATGENVYVQKGSDWATGSLQPEADGTTATLKGELSGITIAAGDELALQFPKSGDISYDGQVGTLADIAENFDYATATVQVASVSATGNIVPTEATTTFENQQAIVKFTLNDKDNNAAISATELIVSDGTNSYTVTPASATSEIYVAIPGFSSQTVTLTATVGDDTYTYEKTGVTFANGQYYEITVKMVKKVRYVKPTITWTSVKDGQSKEPNMYNLYEVFGPYNNSSGMYEPSEISISGTSVGYSFIMQNGATIHLSNLTATFDGNDEFISSASHLNLDISGTNSITCKNENRAIYAYGTLKLSGSGTLTVTGTSNTSYGLNASNYKNGSNSDASVLAAPCYTVTRSEATDNGDGTYTWTYTVALDPSIKLLSTLTPADVCKFVGLDGKVYKSVTDAVSAGTKACGIVAYVGSETGESGYTHGLAIAMKDANSGSTCKWKTSDGTFDNPQRSTNIGTQLGYKESGSSLSTGRDNSTWPAFNAALNNTISISSDESASISASAPTGTSGWFLPSIWQWNQIVNGVTGTTTAFSTAGNENLSASAFNANIPTAYQIHSNYYWSSSEYGIYSAYPYASEYGYVLGHDKIKDVYVRAVFAF